MKVDGVVVWYNPTKENLKNIESYIYDLNKLYIIDNSIEDNFKKIEVKSFLKNKIEYISLKKNMGIAVALNIGLEKAKENKAEFLLTLDQDSSFYNDRMLSKYLELIKNDKERSALYGVRLEGEKKLKMSSAFIEVDKLITSGMIINLEKVKKVGKFKEEFFIDEVDIEYCYRVLKSGEKIKKANDIVLRHKIGDTKVYSIFGKKITKVTHHNYIRRYYLIRNKLYMAKLFPDEAKAYRRRIRREIKNIIFFEKDKLVKLKMCWLAYKDFKNEKMGEIPKEYLKKY